jgi:hypothetical protein
MQPLQHLAAVPTLMLLSPARQVLHNLETIQNPRQLQALIMPYKHPPLCC